MNVKFHKNCENSGKIMKISCERCSFVKFDVIFSVSDKKFYLVLLQMTTTSLALEKCKKRMQYPLNYSGKVFCPLKIKIIPFPGRFRLKVCFTLFTAA